MLAYLQRGGQMVLNLIRPKRKLGWMSFVILSVLLLAFVLVTTPPAAAGLWGVVAGIISSFCLMVATLFLKLTIFLLTFIIQIAAYNGYLDSTAVNYGWVMVRDITNMCFVVILLLIAFGTILGLEQYEWKKMMVKLVLAAILVNFSRVICGVIIDVGQVVMVTFINGVAVTAGGNLITMFNMDKIMSLTGDSKSEINDSEVLMASVAAVGFSAMMLGTMFVFLIMLMARMLTLWVLIVLSPLAFVLSVLPQTQKYASEWWQNFGNNVISGPVVAFFLWLSFVTVGGGNINNEVSDDSRTDVKITDTSEADKVGQESAGISSAMSWSKMANFAIAIGMLLVGAKTAQQLGVAGGSMMSKATDFAKKATALASGAAAGKWLYGKKGAIGKAVGMNIPLIGGKAWQKRGLAVKDKLLQGAEKWNKKVGSRLGSLAQFGSHEKMMKERQAAIEVRKGELSSSVKGFEGFQLGGKEGSVFGKRMGGVERYRAYVDQITGKQMVTKEGSEAYRTARKTAAQRKVLEEDKSARERYAARTMAQKTEAAKLDTAKSKIELDVLTGVLTPSAPISNAPVIPGMAGEYTGSVADREINQNALMSERSKMVTKESTERKTEGLAVEESAAKIEKLGDSIKKLETILAGLAPDGSNAVATYNALPSDLANSVSLVDENGADIIGDPVKMREAVMTAIKASLDAKKGELSQATLDYGKIKIGSGGDFAKQIQLLEAIQKALVKENQKPGSGELSKVLSGFEDGVVNSVGLKKDQEFGKDFTGRKLSRDLEGAMVALKDMQKQKDKFEEEKKETGRASGTVSLSSAGRASRQVEILARQTQELSGTIDLNIISANQEKQGALKDILSKLGLKPEQVNNGLDPMQIEDALRKLKADTDIPSRLNTLGSSMEAVEKLIKDLTPKSEQTRRTSVRNILS